MNVGDVVRLMDSRGCWTLYTVTEHDTLVEGVFVRGSQAWFAIPFHQNGEQDGVQTFVARRPVLEGEPFNPRLHLPEGWHVSAESEGR